VFEHITTLEAAQYVADTDRFTAASITAHHLLLQPQCHLHRRHPAPLLLPAGFEA